LQLWNLFYQPFFIRTKLQIIRLFFLVPSRAAVQKKLDEYRGRTSNL
jgi:hypothetical protein